MSRCTLLSYVAGIVRFAFCLTYLDEILVYRVLLKEHLQHLKVVFQHLKDANLKVKLSKCQFFKKHLNYLGHLISEQSIQPLPEKVAAIKIYRNSVMWMSVIIS